MTNEEKKKKYYYYGGKEKKTGEVRKGAEGSIVPYSFGDIQQDFDRMMERFQKEFEDFWITPPKHRHHMRGFGLMPFRQMMPSVDLEDRGKDFRLTADLPGFSKDNVDIQVTDDAVIIQAQKTQSEQDRNKNYLRRERSNQSFYRRVMLPEPVNSDSAQAKLDSGTLEIVLPKKEPKETKKLKIA